MKVSNPLWSKWKKFQNGSCCLVYGCTSQLLVCHTSVHKTLCKFWTETAWLPQTYISIEEKNLMILKYENARSKLTAWVKEKNHRNWSEILTRNNASSVVAILQETLLCGKCNINWSTFKSIYSFHGKTINVIQLLVMIARKRS